ncbi:hypothetical protein L6164_014321 [Bauhinia variegata]|uniref:Uncharacterized protein n=1 Tax=Bauhinia variegata TaxID=167791 RepID=A0ACB9NGT2_BAUVA|nr:hypothetical protein L6164_014321 [Bauhinia variegata]
MAKKINELVILLVVVASLIHSSAAQTRYLVGDALGWTIPPGGASAYTTWAANKTFTLGDTLVFNFTNGRHDVAKVSKAVFDGCTGGSTIFTITSSPATVTLNETGEQYYICTFSSHCSLGQKLAVNVTRASSSPAPQPSTPPATSPSPSPSPSPVTAPPPQARAPSPSRVPASAPAPAPSSEPVTYTVGDNLGWTIPSNGATAYQTWASGKNFKVGDILVFNFNSNAHDVAEVTKAKYDSCDGNSPLALYNTPPVRVTLNKSGEHYFLCAIPGHCSAGQKLAINVTGSGSTATPPSSAATPPSTTTTPTTPSSLSPTGAATPPPPDSAAKSLRVAGISATLLSIAAALLY